MTIDDVLVEDAERVEVTLASITSGGATLGTNRTAINIIMDDDTASAIIVVAVDDIANNVNGVAGETNILNAFNGDTIGPDPASMSNATLSLAPSEVLPSQLSVNTLNGNISLLPNALAGQYGFNYQICTTIDPNNCQIAAVSITVIPSADLFITKTNRPNENGNIDQRDDNIISGSVTTYELIVGNNGPDSVTGAIVTDIPISGLSCAANDPVTIGGDGAPSGNSPSLI